MSNRNFRVYSPVTTTGWRVIRWCSYAEGEQRVSMGASRRVYDEADRHIGYQPVESRGLDADDSESTRGAITAHEMEIYAGVCFRRGRSRTARLKEPERLGRVDMLGRPLSEEDEVERVVEKVRCWREPGSRAPLVGRIFA